MKTKLTTLLLAITFFSFSQRTVVSTSSVEITRPADATAYAAFDAVASSSTAPTILTFSNINPSSFQNCYITKAKLFTDQSANTARFRLGIYISSVTAVNDNAQQTLLYANNGIKIGSIDFDACSTEGTGSTGAASLNTTIRLPFLISGTTIYALLETLDAFTPASGQKFWIELTTDCN